MHALSFLFCFSSAASALGTSPLVNLGSVISMATGTPAAGAAEADADALASGCAADADAVGAAVASAVAAGAAPPSPAGAAVGSASDTGRSSGPLEDAPAHAESARGPTRSAVIAEAQMEEGP